MFSKPARGKQLRRTHPLARGLVGYWLLNEGTGDKVFDLTGRNNIGTLTNMDPATDWVPSQKGQTLDFDGTNDFVSGSNVDIANTAFTISVWVKTSTFGSRTCYSIGSVGATRQTVAIRLNTATQVNFIFWDDDLWQNVSNNMSNKWTHIVITLDDAFLQSVYQDGILQGTRTAGGYFTGDGTWGIGKWVHPSFPQYYDGLISNVCIYNRALSAEEVYSLYRDPYGMFEMEEVVFDVTAPAPSFDALLLAGD